MLYQILEKLDHTFHFEKASAHCDIPCKIYDPISAQLAVLTMLRMVDILEELTAKQELTVNDQATFTRLVMEKEVHGKIVKDEVRTIWGDYLKQPQIDKFPEIHELTHKIMLATSKAKQHVDKQATLALLALVNRFAEIFWQTKGISTFIATCPYPPAQELVYPALGN